MIRLFLCDARRQNRSIVNLCEEFGVRRNRAKRTNQNDFLLLKSELIRLFLCETREQKRSIVSLCEHFAIRSFVQKEPIRTILQLATHQRRNSLWNIGLVATIKESSFSNTFGVDWGVHTCVVKACPIY